ncbi:hypothetical protein AAKU67_000903 [Oxalobacteraceae bacterium GrIS 2.11]
MKFQPETHVEKFDIAILAGNSRVSRDEASGVITVQAQLAAFQAGLRRAAEIRAESNQLASISLALDHRGTFRKQFLLEGLTNSQKRHPNLAQLHPGIVEVFAPVARMFDIPMTSIAIIHEDSARTHASHIIQTRNLPLALTRLMKVETDSDEDDVDENESGGAGTNNRVTCAAVTSEYFSGSINTNTRILEVYFENDIWSQAKVYTRGALLMQELGSKVQVRLMIVDRSGAVLGSSYSRRAENLPA